MTTTLDQPTTATHPATPSSESSTTWTRTSGRRRDAAPRTPRVWSSLATSARRRRPRQPGGPPHRRAGTGRRPVLQLPRWCLSHPDAAPESNPRGLAVQFRLDNGATDLLAHSINGFPGRVVEDFVDFLGAIAPGGPGPEGYLGSHPAAAAFVHAIQTHGVPASYATLSYWPVNAFRFQSADGTESAAATSGTRSPATRSSMRTRPPPGRRLPHRGAQHAPGRRGRLLRAGASDQ